MSPSPLGPHERAATKLVFQIESSLQSRGCACAAYAGLDWIVSDDTVVRPDVMVVCGVQPGRHLERPPALAIEILSHATADKDRTAKRGLYERAGVGHYVLVDPSAQTVEWLELGHDGLYRDRSGEIAAAARFSLLLPDRCRTPGHDESPRRPDSERLRTDTRKTPLPGGMAADPGSRFPGRGSLGRREQPALEPLIRRATLVELAMTGQSFCC